MNKNVTEQLGGLQNVTCGLIQPGDMVTFTFQGERRIEPVENAEDIPLIGVPVELAESLLDLRVYRKMPVAKQGDIDHATPATISPELDDEVSAATPEHYIPQGSAERKEAPMYRGLIGYFPAALFEVARHSLDSDKKHNAGALDGPTWARGKSTDHLDCIVRHMADIGPVGSEGRVEALSAVAWRSLAALQEECEYRGAKPGVSSRFKGHD